MTIFAGNRNPGVLWQVWKEKAPIRKRQRGVLHDDRIRPISISRIAIILPSISFTITLPWKLSFVRTQRHLSEGVPLVAYRAKLRFLTIVEALPTPHSVIAKAVSLKLSRVAFKLVWEVHFSLLLACFVDCQLRTLPQSLIWRRLSSFLQNCLQLTAYVGPLAFYEARIQSIWRFSSFLSRFSG